MGLLIPRSWVRAPQSAYVSSNSILGKHLLSKTVCCVLFCFLLLLSVGPRSRRLCTSFKVVKEINIDGCCENAQYEPSDSIKLISGLCVKLFGFTNIDCVWTFRSFTDLKLDSVSVSNFTSHLGLVNEEVFSLCLLDKSETFQSIKPLYCTSWHNSLKIFIVIRVMHSKKVERIISA